MTEQREKVKEIIDAAVRAGLLKSSMSRDISAAAGASLSKLRTILQDKAGLSVEEIERIESDVTKSRHVAGFEIIERVGSGGMGAVYKARQVSMDRIVALKTLSADLAEDPVFTARFIREARATAKLNHPNLIQGIDVGKDGGVFYFAMEFVDGATVRKLINEVGAIPVNEALVICEQILKALDYTFTNAGLVHRDIKPHNIMVTRNGTAKLCDLGLAFTGNLVPENVKANVTMGTPLYISPEQARGDKELDIRADIYSLGITLHHMLTGAPPFSAEKRHELLRKHLQDTVPSSSDGPAKIDPQLGLFISKMTAKSPADRYQTPKEALEDINAMRTGARMPHASGFDAPSSLARPESMKPTPGTQKILQVSMLTPRQKTALAAIAAMAGSLAAAVLLIFLLLGLSRPPAAAVSTEPEQGLPPNIAASSAPEPEADSAADAKMSEPVMADTSGTMQGPSTEELAEQERLENIDFVRGKIEKFDEERRLQMRTGKTTDTGAVEERWELLEAAAKELKADELVKKVRNLREREKRVAELVVKARDADQRVREFAEAGRFETARKAWEPISESPLLELLPPETFAPLSYVGKLEKQKVREIVSAVSTGVRSSNFDGSSAMLDKIDLREFSESSLKTFIGLRNRIVLERRAAKERARKRKAEGRRDAISGFWKAVEAVAADRGERNRVHAARDAILAAAEDPEFAAARDWCKPLMGLLDAAVELETKAVQGMIIEGTTVPYMNLQARLVSVKDGNVRFEARKRKVTVGGNKPVDALFPAATILQRAADAPVLVRAVYLLLRGEKTGAKALLPEAGTEPAADSLRELFNAEEGKLNLDAFPLEEDSPVPPPAEENDKGGDGGASVSGTVPPLAALEPVGGVKQDAAEQRIECLPAYIDQKRFSEARRALEDLDGPLANAPARREPKAMLVIEHCRRRLRRESEEYARGLKSALEQAEWVSADELGWTRLQGGLEAVSGGKRIISEPDGEAAAACLISLPDAFFLRAVCKPVPAADGSANAWLIIGLPASGLVPRFDETVYGGVDATAKLAILSVPGLPPKTVGLDAASEYHVDLHVFLGDATLTVNDDIRLDSRISGYRGGRFAIACRGCSAEFQHVEIKLPAAD